MNYWHLLDQAVKTACQSGRLGTPVFVRCTVLLAGQAQSMKENLATLAGFANTWFATSACRVYSLASPDARHLTLSLEYPSGRQALLSLAAGHSQSHIDLTLLGPRGALYHTESIQAIDDHLASPQATGPLQTIIRAIDQSLASGQPVDIDLEAG